MEVTNYRAAFMLFVAMSAAHQAPPKFEPLPPPSMWPSPPSLPSVTPPPRSPEIMFAATVEAVTGAPARVRPGLVPGAEKGRQRASLVAAR
jgi:hypothetical protein